MGKYGVFLIMGDADLYHQPQGLGFRAQGPFHEESRGLRNP